MYIKMTPALCNLCVYKLSLDECYFVLNELSLPTSLEEELMKYVVNFLTQNPIAPRLNIFSSLAFQKNFFYAFARLSRLEFLNSYHIYKTVLDRHVLPN